ncbi:hypothetical protein ACJX0J_002909 (mitochondrion) [Zea mays]
MVTTVKEPVLEIENISDPFIGISIYEQRKEGMNHLTSSGQEARATFQNRYLILAWEEFLRKREDGEKALYAFHPEEGLIARYRLSRVMKGASTILMMMVHFPTGQSDDANLYFLAWLYFIDRGVSGRASAFNQTGTGQDEKQIGGPVLGATTIGRNQEWLPGKRYYLWVHSQPELKLFMKSGGHKPLGSGKQITITGTWEHTDGMNKIRTILGCNLIMSEFVDHAIEDNGNDPFTQFVRNIEFTLSFLQPILWNLFFQHMSSLE